MSACTERHLELADLAQRIAARIFLDTRTEEDRRELLRLVEDLLFFRHKRPTPKK